MVFIDHQTLKTHRAACVNLVGGDPHLRAQAESIAVGEPRRGVPHHGRRVHPLKKGAGGALVGGDDGLGMARPVFIDMSNRLVEVRHHPYRDNFIEIFAGPVFLGGRRRFRDNFSGSPASPQLHPLVPEGLGCHGQKPLGRLPVDKQRFNRVANGDVLRLRVHCQIHRHFGVGGPVDEKMAYAVGMPEHRDSRVRLDVGHELIAAPGDDHVDGLVPREQRADILARLDLLHGVCGNMIRNRPAKNTDERPVAMKRLPAPLQDNGVAGFHA